MYTFFGAFTVVIEVTNQPALTDAMVLLCPLSGDHLGRPNARVPGCYFAARTGAHDLSNNRFVEVC